MEKNKEKNIKFDVLIVILIVIVCIAVCPITLQNDTFYTIKIGEHIINNGFTQQDPFSWHDIPYTYPHWAYDVIIYLIYSIGGFMGLYIANIALSSILGFALYYTHNKITKNRVTSFILTIATLLLVKNYLAARAQLVSYIMFTLTILCIEMFLRTKKKRYAIGLLLISTVIANMHVAVWPFFFVLFLPAIGEYLIVLILNTRFTTKFKTWLINRKIKKTEKRGNEEKLQKLKEDLTKQQELEAIYKERMNEKQEKPYKILFKKEEMGKWLILVMILCVFMGLITPLGDTPYTYLYKTMQGNTTQNIAEHLPLTLVNSAQAMIMLGITIGLITFMNVPVRLKDLFLIGGLIILMFYANRQLALLIILGMIIINKIVCDLINKYDPEGTEKVMRFMATLLGKAVTIVLVFALAYTYKRDHGKEKFIDEAKYPVQAVEYIKENIDLSQGNLYNEYNYGSYLILNDIKVFIDSRADLYTKEFNGENDIFTDFMNISNMNKDHEALFNEYEIKYVLMNKNKLLNKFLKLNDSYKELYSDDNFVIYERESIVK